MWRQTKREDAHEKQWSIDNLQDEEADGECERGVQLVV